MTIGKTRNVTTWVLTALLAVAFLAAGWAKVSGQPDMVAAFAAFGLPDWFRVTIGVLEIAGAVLLVIPVTTGLASLGLAALMLGAVACHAMYDELATALPAVVFIAILGFICLTRKNVVPRALQPYLIG